MEANDFIVKLRANDSKNDWFDLDRIQADYKEIKVNLSQKDRRQFAVNLLCTICRNIVKVPSWCDRMDLKVLPNLVIDCIQETRSVEKPELVKTLACIYHLHKFLAEQKPHPPPELVIKVSLMPFDSDAKELFKELSKTYWNIISDRLRFIEKLKAEKWPIIKALPKLIENILQVMKIDCITSFCSNILTFLIKKLHVIYSERHHKELNMIYGKLFETLARKNDVVSLKKLSEIKSNDLYKKFNNCFYVIADNASKMRFTDSSLNTVVRSCLTLFGHRQDIFHCLQTVYMNSFCSILTDQSDSTVMEIILSNLLISIENIEKLYNDTFKITIPYLNELLRLYIEYHVSNSTELNVDIQVICLKLVLFLIKQIEDTEQMTKCNNCNSKTGLHDSLRLGFATQDFVKENFIKPSDVPKILPMYIEIVEKQYCIIKELRSLKCSNIDKYFRNLQGIVHNIAILLYKWKVYSFSIVLFDLYLKQEFSGMQNNDNLKNISRALYNKSICELNILKYEDALENVYLSLVLSQPEGLNFNKYMNLVIDIKAKSLHIDTAVSYDDKSQLENNNFNSKNVDGHDLDCKKLDVKNNAHMEHLNSLTVLDICDKVIKDSSYGNLRSFISKMAFSTLLQHEFTKYSELWPSIVPIAGVCTSLESLMNKSHHSWLAGENEEILLNTLLEVVLATPAVARTIHNDDYKRVVSLMLSRFDNMQTKSVEMIIANAVLLYLKAEHNLREASVKYKWKDTGTTLDADNFPFTRTIAQEFDAILPALKAVNMLTSILHDIQNVKVTKWFENAVRTIDLFVQLLASFGREAHAQQLAHVCCTLAHRTQDGEIYVRNTSIILYYMHNEHSSVNDMVSIAKSYWEEMASNQKTMETALTFLCDLALYYFRCGDLSSAAKLVQVAQYRILDTLDTDKDVILDLAIGRLLEVQSEICKETVQSILSDSMDIQKQYVLVTGSAACKWLDRRRRSLASRSLVHMVTRAPIRCALSRRARVVSASALPNAHAIGQASLLLDLCDAHNVLDSQVLVDNRLKYILGLQQLNKTKTESCYQEIETNDKQLLTPSQTFETMLANHCQTFKRTQESPSMPWASVPGFKIPDIFNHVISCQCYACQTPSCFILVLQTLGLESSIYFREKELKIATNYFEGTLKCFDLVEKKLVDAVIAFKARNFESYILDNVKRNWDLKLKNVQIAILIEVTFLELMQGNYKKADQHIITINEIVANIPELDPYLNQDILNLIIASAQLKKHLQRHIGNKLEIEIKPSPIKVEEAKTPENKSQQPPVTKNIIVNKDEIPKVTRKGIKLNLVEETPEEKPIKLNKKNQFKMPVPITSKPVLEVMTPRSLTKIVVEVIKPAKMETPKPTISTKEFFTPYEDPIEDQFFSPIHDKKVYSKKSIKCSIVKNLENEFGTPKADNEISVSKVKRELPQATTKYNKRTLIKNTLVKATNSKARNMDEIIKADDTPILRSSRKKAQAEVASTTSNRNKRAKQKSNDDGKK